MWGREGGIIHYNFGGFEVIVEARDCTIIETKKIAGITVASRTYPDPGCKLPEPTPPTPTPTPTTPGEEPSVNVPSDDQVYWAIVGQTSMSAYFTGAKISVPTITDVDKKPTGQFISPVSCEHTPAQLPFLDPVKHRVRKGQFVSYTLIYVGWPGKPDSLTGVAMLSTEIFNQDTSKWEIPQNYERIPLAIFGTGKDLKKLFELDRKYAPESVAIGIERHTNYRTGYYFPVMLIPLKPPLPVVPLPSAGNQPPMPESCCEALKADIEDIKEVLATKEILAGKMTFPWVWRMPGGEGEEIIYDYPNLMRAIAQMIDRLGIHPPKLSIQDINNAVAGDQSLSNQFPSATQGFEALMAQVWDANADVDTLTNFLYRLSWLCVQQSMNLARVSGDIQCIKDMVGGATQPVEDTITTPFNIGAGVSEKSRKGKGFGNNQKIDGKIEANMEISTESLLPDFLKIRENPIVVEKFVGDKDIYDLLTVIILKLESLQRS